MNKYLGVDIETYFKTPWGVEDTYTLGKFVSLIVESAIVISGVIMVFLLIGGGFALIAGAGQGKPETAAKGRKAVTAAVTGFIIIFIAYWIVRALELILKLDIVTNSGL